MKVEKREERERGREREVKEGGQDGERRCGVRYPHGLNMVICHEAESLRKD